MSVIKVVLWGNTIGAVSWDESTGIGSFQYTPEAIQAGLELSPIMMPLREAPYSFPSLSTPDRWKSFSGLPGLIADSLPEDFGNELMRTWLENRGISFDQLNPIERLSYLGTRGMGALEYLPDSDMSFNNSFDVNPSELTAICQDIMDSAGKKTAHLAGKDITAKLIQIGTSAGGAKAKAIVAWDQTTNELRSGQVKAPKGFTYWLLKLSEVENKEHETDKHIGRIEMAYHLMAKAAGINMTECQLIEDNGQAHFMTKRFDRTNDGEKFHVQTFCSLSHQGRNPVGQVGYESLFSTARKMMLHQDSLNELYRRMVFNIIARNQDDHTKNHAFMMDSKGRWRLTPAYDLCFAFKKGSRFVGQHQMSCNGKRDNFTMDDLVAAGRSADIKNPQKIIDEVIAGVGYWNSACREVDMPDSIRTEIKSLFRKL